jgi:hypothetical protein
MDSRRNSAIVPAVILIAIGIVLLLVNTGALPNLNLTHLWPAFPALLGAALLLQFFVGGMRDPGLVTGGTIFLLVGLFFFLFTLRLDVPGMGRIGWGDMARLWPVFPTIVGVALLLQWLAGGLRDHGLLIPVAILLIVGLAGFGFTLADLPTFKILSDYWPVLLILLGLLVIVRAGIRPRAS